MVTLGKLNCDEIRHGRRQRELGRGPGMFDAAQPVRNPWNNERVPGGSSRAAGRCRGRAFAPAVTGTDTGGSIRQPASFCGITGIKPTHGRASPTA